MSSKSSQYCAVIDILVEEPDLRKIAIEISKIAPKVFIQASNNLKDRLPKWQREARNLYEDEGKLNAVKYVKDNQDMHLMDAKRAVENLANRYRWVEKV